MIQLTLLIRVDTLNEFREKVGFMASQFIYRMTDTCRHDQTSWIRLYWIKIGFFESAGDYKQNVTLLYN